MLIVPIVFKDCNVPSTNMDIEIQQKYICLFSRWFHMQNQRSNPSCLTMAQVHAAKRPPPLDPPCASRGDQRIEVADLEENRTTPKGESFGFEKLRSLTKKVEKHDKSNIKLQKRLGKCFRRCFWNLGQICWQKFSIFSSTPSALQKAAPETSGDFEPWDRKNVQVLGWKPSVFTGKWPKNWTKTSWTIRLDGKWINFTFILFEHTRPQSYYKKKHSTWPQLWIQKLLSQKKNAWFFGSASPEKSDFVF